MIGLFRPNPGEAPPTKRNEDGIFETLQANFNAALRDLDGKAEEYRSRRAAASSSPGVTRSVALERAAERDRRIAENRQAIREDIRSMHEKLGTGVDADLEALSAFLREVAVEVDAGKESHELIPRTRARAVQRLHKEAGELALGRLEMLLLRRNLEWPDPTRHEPGTPPEETERSRRRQLAEIRESFLGQSLSRTAERLLGICDGLGLGLPASRLPPLGVNGP
jgi:type I site-specific restriction endonuclease